MSDESRIADLITTIKRNERNAVLDEVKALTFETPEYIANSQEHLRGYNKALDNMNLAIEQLKGKEDES